jgi:hypothetical protein
MLRWERRLLWVESCRPEGGTLLPEVQRLLQLVERSTVLWRSVPPTWTALAPTSSGGMQYVMIVAWSVNF